MPLVPWLLGAQRDSEPGKSTSDLCQPGGKSDQAQGGCPLLHPLDPMPSFQAARDPQSPRQPVSVSGPTLSLGGPGGLCH